MRISLASFIGEFHGLGNRAKSLGGTSQTADALVVGYGCASGNLDIHGTGSVTRFAADTRGGSSPYFEDAHQVKEA